MKNKKTTIKKTPPKPIKPKIEAPEIEIDPDVDVQKLEAQYARLVETKGFVEAFWEFGCEYTKKYSNTSSSILYWDSVFRRIYCNIY